MLEVSEISRWNRVIKTAKEVTHNWGMYSLGVLDVTSAGLRDMMGKIQWVCYRFQ